MRRTKYIEIPKLHCSCGHLACDPTCKFGTSWHSWHLPLQEDHAVKGLQLGGGRVLGLGFGV